MQKEIVIAKEGFEDIFVMLKNKIDEIEIAKENEKTTLCAEIDSKYDLRLADFQNTLSGISKTEIFEIEDEVLVEEQPQEELGEQ